MRSAGVDPHWKAPHIKPGDTGKRFG